MSFVHHKRSVAPPYLIFHMSIPPACSSPLSLLESQRVSGVSEGDGCSSHDRASPARAGPALFQPHELLWSLPHCHLSPAGGAWLIILSVLCSILGYGFGQRKQHHAVNAWALAAGEHEMRPKDWISCLAHETWQIQLLGCAWWQLTFALVQAVYLKTLPKSNCVILNECF